MAPVVRVPAPRREVDLFQVGDSGRVVELPNPVPVGRVSQVAVEEFLLARGVAPEEFRSYLDADVAA